MEGENYSEAKAPKEVSEQPSPVAPTLSTSGQMKMSEPLPPEPAEVPPAPVPTDQPPPPPAPETPVTPVTEAKTPPAQTVETQKQPEEIPLPLPDNPETKEVSGSKEVGLGRDDGQAAATNAPVDDPTAVGRRRIQEALKSTQPVAPTSQLQPTDSAVASSGDTALPPTSISLPAEPTDDLTLPPVSPPLPTDTTNPPSNPPPVTLSPSGYQPSDDPIVFRTDHPPKDFGGAAEEMNRENADINKANRELFEARAEAKHIEAETGLSIDEYRNQAAFRLAHPEFYDSSDPQEILNSSVPVSPPLPTTAETIASPANLYPPGGGTIIPPSTTPLSADSSTTSLPPVSPSIPGYMPSNETDKLPNDWKNLGIINIPIADLPEPDGVNSPDDFNHHISWEDAKSATLQLPQIQKEVALGKTGDDFYAEDQAAGLDQQHGRKRVYDLYYSNTDPIQVDKDGGLYIINSGRHRIYAAKTLGLKSVPALVREKHDLTNPQEILNSSAPVGTSLPTTVDTIASPDNLYPPGGGAVILPKSADSTISLPPISPPLTDGSTTVSPVSPSLPVENITSQLINVDADVTNLKTLPDGRLAVISGNPEIKKQFTHLQGTSTLEYITPDGVPLKFKGTCGIVCCEDIARQQGIDATEDDLVRLAAEKNLCVNDALDSNQLGGTTDASRAEILDQLGIPNELISASSLEELAGYIENGQSAIAAVNAGLLWDDADYFENGWVNHAITVTGVARALQSGEVLGFFINDSGTGEAGKFISASQFKNAWLNRGGRLNITLPRN